MQIYRSQLNSLTRAPHLPSQDDFGCAQSPAEPAWEALAPCEAWAAVKAGLCGIPRNHVS